MRTLIICMLAAGAFLPSAPVRAHLVEQDVVALTVDAEVPAPTGTSNLTGGSASIELGQNLAIAYDVSTVALTGPALAAHIHQGAVGVQGDVVFTLTKVSDTQFQGETEPLTPDQLTTFLAGGYYLNVHTATNGDGEIRGQIDKLRRVDSGCSCTRLTRKIFLQCVKRLIKVLPKEQKKSAAGKTLRKAAKKSSCGLTKTKKTGACCVPPIDLAAEIVQGELCVPVAEKKAEKQCAKLGGTVLAGQSCIPTNPCLLPASPSGAFLDHHSEPDAAGRIVIGPIR